MCMYLFSVESWKTVNPMVRTMDSGLNRNCDVIFLIINMLKYVIFVIDMIAYYYYDIATKTK